MQGDPLSMIMYSAAVLPLVCSLEDSHQWIQNWYADDSSCIGKLSSVMQWFKRLLSDGHTRGYFLEPTKIVLVV